MSTKWRVKNADKYKIHSKNYRESIRARYLYMCAKNKRVWKLESDITFDQYTKIVSSGCQYCGELIHTGIGLDRIDNSEPYTFRNVLPCCFRCNTAKHTMSMNEFVSWIRKIYERTKIIGDTLEGPSPTLVRRDIDKSTVGDNQEQWVQNRVEELRRLQQIHFFN